MQVRANNISRSPQQASRLTINVSTSLFLATAIHRPLVTYTQLLQSFSITIFQHTFGPLPLCNNDKASLCQLISFTVNRIRTLGPTHSSFNSLTLLCVTIAEQTKLFPRIWCLIVTLSLKILIISNIEAACFTDIRPNFNLMFCCVIGRLVCPACEYLILIQLKIFNKIFENSLEK